MPLLPAPHDIPLHIEVNKFLRQDIASFEELCHGIYTVCQRSYSFCLGNYEQNAIYQKLLALKMGGDQHNNATFEWHNPIVLTHWIVIVSHCANLPHRDMFLKIEAQLIEQTRNLIVQEIRAPLVSYTLSHLPKLFDAENLPLILRQLLPYLARIKDDGQIIVLQDICRALKGLKYVDQKDQHLQEILKHLAWHIKQNITQGHYFSDAHLAISFRGLCNRSLNSSTEVVLVGLLEHLQHFTQEKKWLDGDNLALIMEGLQNMPSHDVTNAVMSEITQHLDGNAAQGTWLKPYTASKLMSYVYTKQENTVLNPFFDAIKRHLQYSFQQGSRAIPDTVGEALLGLRHLSVLPTTGPLLDLFAAHLTLPGGIIPPTKNYLQRWLANAIDSLDHYLDQATTQQPAIDLIQQALKIFQPLIQPKLNPDDLLKKDAREKTILTLGAFILENSKQIDLTHYRCSVDLMTFLCSFLMKMPHTDFRDWSILLDDNYDAYEKKQIHTYFCNRLGSTIKLQSFDGTMPDVSFTSKNSSMESSPNVNTSSSQPRRKRSYMESSSSEEVTTDEESSTSQIEAEKAVPLKKPKLNERENDIGKIFTIIM